MNASRLLMYLLLSSACFAYMWRDPPSIAREMDEAKIVVIGRAESHREICDADGFIVATIFRVAVIGAIKCDGRKEVLIHVPNDSGRFWLEDGRTYLIFAKQSAEEGFYSIDTTGNSQEISDGNKTKPAARANTARSERSRRSCPEPVERAAHPSRKPTSLISAWLSGNVRQRCLAYSKSVG